MIQGTAKLKAIDLFCGAGGSSTGAAQAGVRIVAAVNHWSLAVETHAANHPETQHYCQDAGLLDPATLPAHDLLLASPSCQGHSRARGTDQPRHDASRATAWCVVNVAEITRPKYIVVENVPDFTRWALFAHWWAALESLGYHLTQHLFDAADFGVAQNRSRLIITGSLRRSIKIKSPAREHIAAKSIVDLSAGQWSPIKGHCDKTLARVACGRKQHGQTFVMPYYGGGSGLTGRCLSRPLGTVTTLDRWAIVHGDLMRMLTVDEYRQAMGFPADYVLRGTRRDQIKQLGNAVVPAMMRHICDAIGRA